MDRKKLPYFLLFFALFLLNTLIFLAPYLASIGDGESAGTLYFIFGPTCHQLASRSLCLFKSKADGSYFLGDCLPSPAFSPSKEEAFDYPDKTGYKFPVCARDTAIYFFMLIGLAALPFFQKIESDRWPDNLILIAAAIPIGVDGGGQLLGLWESTNLSRIITGAIIGTVLPFYILAILNSLAILIFHKNGRKSR
ncbi:MAG: DUF2085 domain-containing protein [Candidatus Micrarchaeota archaeon]|nr:DUF2085 domain-containing protein [Candidatus Micrarchaeota archaeon]